MNELHPHQNVIDLATVKCPIGSKTWHKKYRVCYVTQSIGGQRQIKTIQKGSWPAKWIKLCVHVNELTEI